MKKYLFIVLLVGFGFSQKFIEVVETYDNGNIKNITYHEKTQHQVKKIKFEEYFDQLSAYKEPYLNEITPLTYSTNLIL